MIDRVGLRRPGRGDRRLDAPLAIAQDVFAVLPHDVYARPEPGDPPRYAHNQLPLQVVRPLVLRNEPAQIAEFDKPRLFLFAVVVLAHKRKAPPETHLDLVCNPAELPLLATA